MTTETLPQAITGAIDSPVLARIGVVASITEADNIVVKISGSDVLIQASYLFPQYQPLLGDIVYVTKQDAQWLVLGTMSGAINSQVPNPSFETGTTGATPTSWTITSVSAAAGTITLQKEQGDFLGQPISGRFVGAIDFIGNGVIGTSSSNIFSTAVPASAGQYWTAAFWIAGGTMSFGVTSIQEMFIQWLDAGGALISEDSAMLYTLANDTLTPQYMRPRPTLPRFLAPAGTASVRLRLNVPFTVLALTGSLICSVLLDYMILRNVT